MISSPCWVRTYLIFLINLDYKRSYFNALVTAARHQCESLPVIGAQRWHVKGLEEEVVLNAKCDYGRVCFLYEDLPVIFTDWVSMW